DVQASPSTAPVERPPMTHGIIAAALAMLVASAASAAPYRPSDDATVLVTLPHAPASTAFRKAQNALPPNPTHLTLPLHRPSAPRRAVARRGAGRARPGAGRAGAPGPRRGRAGGACGRGGSTPPPPISVRVLRAIIRQSLHDFAGAVADLDVILGLDPRNGQARLTRAFVRQAVGALADARDDCRRLPPSVGVMAAAVCLLRGEAWT